MDQRFQSESFICSVKFDSELMNAVKCYDFKKHLAKQAVINRDSCGTDVVCLHYCSKWDYFCFSKENI